MASPLPSTSTDSLGASSQSSSRPRRFLRTAEVLAEIFHDSDSGGSSDGSDSEPVETDDITAESEVSDVEQSEEEDEAVQAPPANKGKGKALQKPTFVWKVIPIHPVIHQFTGVSEINPDLLESLPDEPTPLDFVTFFSAWRTCRHSGP